MSARTPICLLMDDPCPLVHVYRNHWEDVHKRLPETNDGRRLLDVVPNDFLDRYCDVIERFGIKGKFSIVPSPAGKGDVVNGVEGFDPALTRSWLDTARTRLGPFCDFCPEGITHNLAVDLEHGGYFAEGESEWSQRQDRRTLTPYLIRSLELLRDAGIPVTGVTSPWVFGIDVEPEYVASIVEAQRVVNGLSESWYFLHMKHKEPSTRPWIALREGGATLVAIASTVSDIFWRTIDSPRTDADFVASVVEEALTDDGRSGRIIEVLDAGGWPVILTHWQSVFSNGLETGIAALAELAGRIERHLSDRVEWMTCSEIARMTVAGAL